jgi:hypothetical protein
MIVHFSIHFGISALMPLPEEKLDSQVHFLPPNVVSIIEDNIQKYWAFFLYNNSYSQMEGFGTITTLLSFLANHWMITLVGFLGGLLETVVTVLWLVWRYRGIIPWAYMKGTCAHFRFARVCRSDTVPAKKPHKGALLTLALYLLGWSVYVFILPHRASPVTLENLLENGVIQPYLLFQLVLFVPLKEELLFRVICFSLVHRRNVPCS